MKLFLRNGDSIIYKEGIFQSFPLFFKLTRRETEIQE